MKDERPDHGPDPTHGRVDDSRLCKSLPGPYVHSDRLFSLLAALRC